MSMISEQELAAAIEKAKASGHAEIAAWLDQCRTQDALSGYLGKILGQARSE
jgi:hypothetical protein